VVSSVSLVSHARVAGTVVLLGLAGFLGCSATKSESAIRPRTAATTLGGSTAGVGAVNVVRDYYEACAHGDAVAAEGTLSTKARIFETGTVAPMWSNTVRLTGLTVLSVRPDLAAMQVGEPGFTDITQVTVEYSVTWKDYGKAGSSNGQTTNFDCVGRAVDGTGWRILNIRGGP
jgi:hypothetical protein